MSRGSTDKALSAIYEVLEDDVLQCGEKAGLTKAEIISQARASKFAQSQYTRELIPQILAGLIDGWEDDDSQQTPELDLALRNSPDGELRYLLRREEWPDAEQARSAAMSGLWCDHASHEGRNEFEDCPEDCEHSHEDLDEWINCPASQYNQWVAEREKLLAGQ